MKPLSFLLSLLLPVTALATNVSQERAEAIAEDFFAKAQPSLFKSAAEMPQLKMVWDGEDASLSSYSEVGSSSEDASFRAYEGPDASAADEASAAAGVSAAEDPTNAPAFYVFNNESSKGFVIVSGDERTAQPILGYALDQNFDAQSMPENLRGWLLGYKAQINEARENGVFSENAEGNENNERRLTGKENAGNDQSIDRLAKATEINPMEPIKLLETALWDQRNPYNSKLPLGYVTGCPATAISIIMRYHQWPEKGVGTIPASNEQIGAVKLGHVYDWSQMPLVYTEASTAEENEQVGILMRDAGAMVRTQYGGGTAGANPEETLPQLMPIYMRYNAKTIQSLFKKDFSDAEWHALMQKELDEERPILYGGYSSGGGHQFVLDGYAKGNYYHVNWGWSGVSNGYYLLTTMNPPEQGAGGSTSADGFTKKQDAIIGIQPDPSNPGGGHFDLIAYKPFYKEKPFGMISHATEYEQGVEFQVDLKEFQNKGSRAFRGQLAIAHFADDGTMKGVICKKNVDYSKYPQEINDFTEAYLKCVISAAIEPGDYIAGVYKYQNPSAWTVIRNGYSNKPNCTEKIVLKAPLPPEPPVPTDVPEVDADGSFGADGCDGAGALAAVRVYGVSGAIMIDGLTELTSIAVYNVSGRLVASAASDDSAQIDLPTSQVYIVRVGEKSVKVRL